MAIRFQYFETLSCDLILQFKWLIRVANCTKGNAASGFDPFSLSGQDLGCVYLDIDELAPGFSVASEPLHEDRIAILAFMGAAIVGIDRIIDT
jgi:hypothetical protein